MIDNILPSALRGADKTAIKRAEDRVRRLGIPKGSLGRLHELAIRVAGVQGDLDDNLRGCTTFVCCGDHGIARRNVSAFDTQVTRTNLLQMLRGRATISNFCEVLESELKVADFGVAGERVDAVEGQNQVEFYDLRVRDGTRDFVDEPALKKKEVQEAVRRGYDWAVENTRNTAIGVVGDMGIGNTSATAALTAAITGVPLEKAVGHGSGIGEDKYKHKIDLLKRAFERAGFDYKNGGELSAAEAMQQFGGLEIAGMVGVYVGLAKTRTVAVIDGYISTVAAVLATKVREGCEYCLVPGTKSAVVGHSVLLESLGAEPVLDLDMRLGEGSAAILAVPIIRCAVRQLSSIGTIDEI